MKELKLLITPDEVDTEAAEVYVEGIVGNRKYSFILDTGSARTSIQFDGYTSKFETYQKNNSSGIFAKSIDDLIIVPQIKLGPILKKDFTLVRFPEDAVDVKNLIGMDLLKDFCCYFLFEESKVLIDFSVDDKIHDASQELYLGKRFHPYIDVHFGELKTSSIWDTGAGITVVDMNFIEKHPSYFQKEGKSIGTDSTGTKRYTPIFTMFPIIIDNNEFLPHKVAGVDLAQLNSTTERHIDIVLGYSTLSKANWVFNFPQKKWAILKMLTVIE